MSAYREFTGKSVEEALRHAREEFAVGLDELDFEILTPGSRGVLGMGAEPARIVAAPRAALGGAAPKREAAAATPLPPVERPPRRDDRPPRRDDRPPRFDDRGPRRDDRPAPSFTSAPGGDAERGAAPRSETPRTDAARTPAPRRPPRAHPGPRPAPRRPTAPP